MEQITTKFILLFDTLLLFTSFNLYCLNYDVHCSCQYKYTLKPQSSVLELTEHLMQKVSEYLTFQILICDQMTM
jgi:hypothetical protein